MMRLGHHVFTSFGGQRTVFLSPWLASWRERLDERATAAYAGDPGFEVVHGQGCWWITLVSANGRDHVGRPRQLVHQVVVEDTALTPPVSPLALLPHLLTRLEHDDPYLGQRLPDPLPSIALPAAPDLVAACTAARPILAGAMDAILTGQWSSLAAPAEAFDAIVATAGIPWAFDRSLWVGTFARPLPPPAAAPTAGVRLWSSPSATVPVAGSAGAWLVDLLLRHGRPGSLVGLLASLPATVWSSPAQRALLGNAIHAGWPDVITDGVPQIAPDDHRTEPLLCALVALGAPALASRVMSAWRPVVAGSRLAGELEHAILAPSMPGIATICARIDDLLNDTFLASMTPSQPFPHLGADP